MKTKSKRALLGLGLAAAVFTPITTVVACGESEEIYAEKSEVAEQVKRELESEIVNSNKYGTFVDEEQVLLIIKDYVSAVTKDDLVFAGNDAMGTLTITILNYYKEGDNLIITLEGFQAYEQSDTIPANAYKNEILPAWFTVPETVTSIGEEAFYNAYFFGGFTLANTQVETIGYDAFFHVTLPAGFALPDSVTSIGEEAFSGATFLGNFTLANTQVETIGDGVFNSVDLPAGFVLPDSLKTIGDGAFFGATFLGDFTLANTQVETIGYNTFAYATFLGDFVLPNSLTTIGDWAFYETTFLGDFTLANTQVETIGELAFNSVDLPVEFALPDSVTTIGDWAFVEATLPNEFAIPKNVTIGTDAFKNVQMAEDLTWFNENGVEQTPEETPEPGWYIAPKS